MHCLAKSENQTACNAAALLQLLPEVQCPTCCLSASCSRSAASSFCLKARACCSNSPTQGDAAAGGSSTAKLPPETRAGSHPVGKFARAPVRQMWSRTSSAHECRCNVKLWAAKQRNRLGTQTDAALLAKIYGLRNGPPDVLPNITLSSSRLCSSGNKRLCGERAGTVWENSCSYSQYLRLRAVRGDHLLPRASETRHPVNASPACRLHCWRGVSGAAQQPQTVTRRWPERPLPPCAPTG